MFRGQSRNRRSQIGDVFGKFLGGGSDSRHVHACGSGVASMCEGKKAGIVPQAGPSPWPKV
jgi:hypothetical protein